MRLLSSMASAKEISQYLKRLLQLDAKRFAVVKVGGAVLRDDLEALTSSLAFLQEVGLTPIVVHGAGPQLDEELAAAGIEKKTIDGLRVTSPEALAIVRRVFQAQNLKLVEALQETDARATSIMSGVFEAEYLDRDTLGLRSGRSRQPRADRASLNAGSIPVIASMGETRGRPDPQRQCRFRRQRTRPGAAAVQDHLPHRHRRPARRPGPRHRFDQPSTEYAHLAAQPWINGGMRVKIDQIKQLLDRLPLTSSVSITKPAELAKELFTHKGSGTLVRRGETVLRASRWDELDLARLRTLIESSFGRRLVEDYFERTRLHRAYVSENYRTALILTDEDGLAYLDKFAVLDDAQGEGLGRAVWQVMRAENPRLFWRSRHGNPVNPFYYSESDGCWKQEKWKVYWYGIDDFDLVRSCVERCASRPRPCWLMVRRAQG